jgi:hypothetical protein
MRYLAAWIAVGAILQLGVWLYGQAKFGRRNGLGMAVFAKDRLWPVLLSALMGCFLWPIGIVVLFLPGRIMQRLFSDEIAETKRRLKESDDAR